MSIGSRWSNFLPSSFPNILTSYFLWPKVMQWLFLKNSQEIQIFSDKSTFWRHRRCRKVKVGFSGRSGLLFCSFFPFWKLELAFYGRKLLKLMWFNHKTLPMLRESWETLIPTKFSGGAFLGPICKFWQVSRLIG